MSDTTVGTWHLLNNDVTVFYIYRPDFGLSPSTRQLTNSWQLGGARIKLVAL